MFGWVVLSCLSMPCGEDRGTMWYVITKIALKITALFHYEPSSLSEYLLSGAE